MFILVLEAGFFNDFADGTVQGVVAKSELVVAEAGTFLISNFNDFLDLVAVPLGADLAASTTSGSLDGKGFEGKATWGVLPFMRALA